ncbi:MAG: class II fructose-bisphosphatase [Ardenticatenaceae bacterium]|nr:class II fructose-bisphosphatase [Ardenticatenaceae bacterium]MCB8948770.1 class II fructose-bisphosphatase [Ardenticatenaceae bacterium]
MNEITTHTFDEQLSRNVGLDLVRVTETTALAAGSWVGSGDFANAHRAATRAMADALNTLEMNGHIVIGEEDRLGEDSPLCSGQSVGTGQGPEVDILVDPIDGTNLLINGKPGAVSVVGIAPRGTVWSPVSARYMEKIVVDQRAAAALVPQCMDAPAAWTLALIARHKKKSVRDLSVIVLERSRNQDLIEEIRECGARVLLREEGDAEGALIAATNDTDVDVLMGIGGVSQGVLAACAVKASGGAMLARLRPQDEAERESIRKAGLDENRILSCSELVNSNQIFFAATSITGGALMRAMQFWGNYASTHSLLIRSETGTRRIIHAEHGTHL